MDSDTRSVNSCCKEESRNTMVGSPDRENVWTVYDKNLIFSKTKP